MDLVVALLVLLPLALLLLRLMSLPAAEEDEELAGLVAGNWPHVRDLLEREP